MGKGSDRNLPCHCGSGIKYKNCCWNKDTAPAPTIPKEVIEFFQKQQAERDLRHQAGLFDHYVEPVIFNGKKVWAFGSAIYTSNDVNQTFHEFLVDVLKRTLGVEWWEEQMKLPLNERHYIALCLAKTGEWILRERARIGNIPLDGPLNAMPDGYVKSLLLLAFDVSSLVQKNILPETLLQRLKSRREYQGARYEIAIAAIFSRMGCDIEWTDVNSKNKHCEFVAKHRETGFTLAVEVKSKHRAGVIHEEGSPVEELSARMRRTFNEALTQNPKDVPFAIFIDVNLPATPNVALDEKPWVQEAKTMVTKKLKGLDPGDYPLNAAFFTNFSYHYQSENEAEQGESMGVIIPHPKYPAPDPEFFNTLNGALRHYGYVPSPDVRKPL